MKLWNDFENRSIFESFMTKTWGLFLEHSVYIAYSEDTYEYAVYRLVSSLFSMCDWRNVKHFVVCCHNSRKHLEAVVAARRDLTFPCRLSLTQLTGQFLPASTTTLSVGYIVTESPCCSTYRNSAVRSIRRNDQSYRLSWRRRRRWWWWTWLEMFV